VALEGKHRPIDMREPLDRSVEKRAMSDAQGLRKAGLVDGKAVILARDQHAPRLHIKNRVIGPMVAKLHLDGAPAQGQGQELMTETNAKTGIPDATSSAAASMA